MKKLLATLFLTTTAYGQTCPCPSPSPTVAPTAQPTPNPGSAACQRIIRSKWLYKPESEDTRDNREGKPMTLFDEGIRVNGSSLRVLDIHGKKMCTFGRFTNEDTRPQRYYSGHPAPDYCNRGPKELAALALEKNGNGTSWIYILLSATDGEKRCIRIPDPTQRLDNR